jgi:hypothetical protein
MHIYKSFLWIKSSGLEMKEKNSYYSLIRVWQDKSTVSWFWTNSDFIFLQGVKLKMELQSWQYQITRTRRKSLMKIIEKLSVTFAVFHRKSTLSCDITALYFLFGLPWPVKSCISFHFVNFFNDLSFLIFLYNYLPFSTWEV